MRISIDLWPMRESAINSEVGVHGQGMFEHVRPNGGPTL